MISTYTDFTILKYNIKSTVIYHLTTHISINDSVSTEGQYQCNILIINKTQSLTINKFGNTFRDACSITVIAEGNGIIDPSSNPGWGCLHFTLH